MAGTLSAEVPARFGRGREAPPVRYGTAVLSAEAAVPNIGGDVLSAETSPPDLVGTYSAGWAYR